MATDTITIKVDPEAAKAYKGASAADQKKMRALLSLRLRDVANAEPATLNQIMDDIGKKAQARGLTPAVLQELLKEA